MGLSPQAIRLHRFPLGFILENGIGLGNGVRRSDEGSVNDDAPLGGTTMKTNRNALPNDRLVKAAHLSKSLWSRWLANSAVVTPFLQLFPLTPFG
jgi:hypothetical protein